MPALKQSSPDKFVAAPKCSGPKLAAQQPVQQGSSSAATKEAVKSYADQHRAAMIRLADR